MAIVLGKNVSGLAPEIASSLFDDQNDVLLKNLWETKNEGSLGNVFSVFLLDSSRKLRIFVSIDD